MCDEFHKCETVWFLLPSPVAVGTFLIAPCRRQMTKFALFRNVTTHVWCLQEMWIAVAGGQACNSGKVNCELMKCSVPDEPFSTEWHLDLASICQLQEQQNFVTGDFSFGINGEIMATSSVRRATGGTRVGWGCRDASKGHSPCDTQSMYSLHRRIVPGSATSWTLTLRIRISFSSHWRVQL